MAHNKFGFPGMSKEDRVDSAARTLKEFAQIKSEPELMKAARSQLKQEIKDNEKLLKTI